MTCGVIVALSVPTLGAASFAGAAVAGATLVAKVVDKYYKPDEVELIQQAFEMADTEKVSTCLNSIVKDVAKELSRIFESQIFEMKNEKQVEVLAKCAVALMLKLNKGDIFDRNTLIRKVLRDGKLGKKTLHTRADMKLSAPNVFRKPGLRQIVVKKDGTIFKYSVKPHNGSKTWKYGFRGEFYELTILGKTLCKKLCDECCGNNEICTSGLYFIPSDIDSEYTEPAPPQQHQYLPIHVSIQCPKVLDSFKQSNETDSLVNFLKMKLRLPESLIIHPVYRPHSPMKVADLRNSNLERSDFSHSDFTDSSLQGCKFDKCVMLFTTFTRAKMSGSSFCDTLISHSRLNEVKLDHSKFLKTSILHSYADGLDIHEIKNLGDLCWTGTDLSTKCYDENPDCQRCKEKIVSEGKTSK